MLEQISFKWLGEPYPAPEPPFFIWHRLYIITLAGLFMIASALVWVWNLQLRGQVRRRTADLARS